MSLINVEIKDKRTATKVVVSALKTWTVEQLKKKYALLKQNTDLWNAYTFHNGSSTLMNNADPLLLHNIVDGSKINALYAEPQLPVQVRGLDGRTTKITAYPSWTVRRLKEEYARWLGEGWDNVVLLYKAKRLKDDEVLSVYKIEKSGFIAANVRSTGGK